MENAKMKRQNTEDTFDDEDSAVIADAARHAVLTESKKAIAAGYKIMETPKGRVVIVDGFAPVELKRRGEIKVKKGVHNF